MNSVFTFLFGCRECVLRQLLSGCKQCRQSEAAFWRCECCSTSRSITMGNLLADRMSVTITNRRRPSKSATSCSTPHPSQNRSTPTVVICRSRTGTLFWHAYWHVTSGCCLFSAVDSHNSNKDELCVLQRRCHGVLLTRKCLMCSLQILNSRQGSSGSSGSSASQSKICKQITLASHLVPLFMRTDRSTATVSQLQVTWHLNSAASRVSAVSGKPTALPPDAGPPSFPLAVC